MKKESKNETQSGMISVVRMTKMSKKGKNPTVAFATVRFAGFISVTGIRLLDWGDNYSCEFPSQKGTDKDGKEKYFPIVFADLGKKEDNVELYEEVTKALVKEFEK